MTLRSALVETSLLYPSQEAPIKKIGVDALHSLFTILGHPINDIRRHRQDYIFVDCDQFQVAIIGCGVPFPKEHFIGANFPGPDRTSGLRMRAELARHASSITVLVAEPDGVEPEEGLELLTQWIGWHLVYLLMEMTQPDLVFWVENDRLMTPDMTTEALRDFHRSYSKAHQEKAGASADGDASQGDMTEEEGRPASPLNEIFSQDPMLSSDVLEWFHMPKHEQGASGGKAAESDQEPKKATTSLPGVGNWLRRMSHVSRATVATSLMTSGIALYGLPVKASEALDKLF